MNGASESLNRAMHLATWADCVFLVTVDPTGRPAFTHVEKCKRDGENRVSTYIWMDTSLLPDGLESCHAALLIWQSRRKEGFEISGRAVEEEQTAVLDGYTLDESRPHLAQMQKEIAMEVDGVRPLRIGVA